MASVTKSSDEKSMPDEELPDEHEEKTDVSPKGPPAQVSSGRKEAPRGASYFTIYKKGQGYWTRIGTLMGVVLIGAFTAYSLYVAVSTRMFAHRVYDPRQAAHQQMVEKTVTTSITSIFCIGYIWLAWHLMNKPRNADFLIATDSEMKKVNWTSRKELIGSTKIVIVFMFLTALFLFAVDWIFGTLMYWMGVMSVPPWGV
jgi:preprotein translocase subunit SecE